jgi:hypothetical protein
MRILAMDTRGVTSSSGSNSPVQQCLQVLMRIEEACRSASSSHLMQSNGVVRTSNPLSVQQIQQKKMLNILSW